MRRALLLAAALVAGCADEPASPVRLGVDVLLDERIELVAGKRVGLVTNPSGVDGDLVATADRLARDSRFELVRLFGPEHGIRGDAYAGDEVADDVDPLTGLPVVSLYGESRRPPAEALEGLDAILFDIQDVGARFYTYVSTLGEVMTAAAEVGLPVVVLDRPNPLGGDRTEGPIREEAWTSFISWSPIPITHAMTVGELAGFYRDELGIACELDVVRMDGWTRDMRWEDTGLTWVQTSPHIPHARSAHVYPATCLIGEVTDNVDVGVGYTLPFETCAAEFIDAATFADELNGADLEGVRFTPIAYRPFYGDLAGKMVRGVRIVLDDPAAFRPVRTALTLLTTLERLYPDSTSYREGRPFALRWGNEDVLGAAREGRTVAEIEAGWAEELEAFRAARRRQLLY